MKLTNQLAPPPPSHIIRKTAAILVQSCHSLALPPYVALTAQTLTLRAWTQKAQIHILAMAALFLACKHEELPRRLRDIVNVMELVVHHRGGNNKEPGIIPFGTEYYELRESLVIAELHILRTLAFDIHVHNPYGLLIAYLGQLGFKDDHEMIQRCWNYANDAIWTDIYLTHQPSEIASTLIWISSTDLDRNMTSEPPWWTYFDASWDEMKEIKQSFDELYQDYAPNRIIEQ